MNAPAKTLPTSAKVPAWAFWLLPLLVLLAGAPLGGRYLYYLTLLPQYEFTVVFLLALLGIVAIRRKEYFVEQPRSSRLGVVLSVLAFLAMSAGVLIASSWCVYLAVILGVGAIFSFVGDGMNGYPLFPLWGALLIPLRPPLGYDQTALNQLRLIASEGASRIADLLGVPHLLQGNVFHLADKEMFMDDACSGIISLLTCMACAALIAIWRRRGTVHFLLLVIAAGIWAVIFNIVRVEILLCAWHWLSIDLTSGWKHDLLGYGALLSGILCLLASDVSLNWMFLETTQSKSVITQFWNRRLANPDFTLIEPIERTGNAWSCFQSSFQLRRPQVVIAAILVGLVLIQIPREVKAWTFLSGNKRSFTVAGIRPAPFPEMIGAWRHAPQHDTARIWRLGHEIKSAQAAYQRESDTMIVAVAYPYDHWHDIAGCYEIHNWKIDLRDFPADSLPNSKRAVIRDAIVHLEMNREEVEYSTVLFAFVDAMGEPIRAPRPKKNVIDAMRSRFAFAQEWQPNFEGFLVQVMWPRSDRQWNETEFKEQLSLFEKILDQIRVEWTQQAETKP